MDFDRRLKEIVEGAEKAVAALAAEAASQRDYARAGMLLAVAQRIEQSGRLPAAARVQHFNPAVGNGHHAPPPAPLPQATAAVPSDDAGERRASPVPRRTKPSDYPRFRREGETLVKIGWSKSDGSTYEHRSPLAVLHRLVARVGEVGRGGRRFTSDELLPLPDGRGGEWPSYQVYLCLAWLVSAGLLVRHGRQGYTLNTPTLAAAVEERWRELPAG